MRGGWRGEAGGLPERSGGLNPYKLTPKMFWRLNKIASDKRKLLESGKKKKFTINERNLLKMKKKLYSPSIF